MTKHGDLQIGVKSANKSESRSILSIQIVMEEKSKAITTALVYLDQRPWPHFFIESNEVCWDYQLKNITYEL
jgi:hypothetical protein